MSKLRDVYYGKIIVRDVLMENYFDKWELINSFKALSFDISEAQNNITNWNDDIWVYRESKIINKMYWLSS